MATIRGTTDERIFRILKWGGLNENPDGDTKLQLGEASAMRNFRITRDANLQRRPGLDLTVGVMQTYTLTESAAEDMRVDDGICSQLIMHQTVSATADGFITHSADEVIVDYTNWQNYVGYYWIRGKYYVWKLVSLTYNATADTYTWRMKRVKATSSSTNKKVQGLWSGTVAGAECMVAACDGKLWKIHDGSDWCKVAIGTLTTTNRRIHMFGYSGKLYIMNGLKYYEWDGTTFKEVEGYIPLVVTNIVGINGGQTLEQINKLSPKRRVWITTDGTNKTFALPEKALASIDYIKDRSDDSTVPASSYTKDATNGTVTFGTAPAAGVNSYEIGYSIPSGETQRGEVEAMRFSELFNGENDNRVFLYGDGSNQAIYSGLDYDGNPRADYFPDMNVLVIGEANTPITAMIRQYSRLVVFKTNSTYSVQYSVSTQADNTTIPVYYSTPVNRDLGNAPPGQVRLVLNAPYTVFGNDIYEWRSNARYASNLTADERQAHRMSDRVYAVLGHFTAETCYCWDDNDSQEYYVCNTATGDALVYNYAADAWYFYTDFPACSMCNHQGKLYVGDMSGNVASFEYGTRTDYGEAIDSYWESGSIPFDREYMRKYSAQLWVGIKPEAKAEVYVTVQTDRKSQYTEKIVSSSLSSFASANFAHWSFATNRKPHQKRLKIKAKKFVYYKVIFKTDDPETTVTILNSDIRVRYTGYAR